MQLRTYVMVDSMQPQYAAFTGKRTLGMIPIVGDAQIYIEMSPAAEVYKVMDKYEANWFLIPAHEAIFSVFGTEDEGILQIFVKAKG